MCIGKAPRRWSGVFPFVRLHGFHIPVIIWQRCAWLYQRKFYNLTKEDLLSIVDFERDAFIPMGPLNEGKADVGFSTWGIAGCAHGTNPVSVNEHGPGVFNWLNGITVKDDSDELAP